MNTDKMRRQLARTTEAAERHEYARWLASLTPEHRRKHVNPMGAFCMECIAANISAANASLRRTADLLNARTQ